MATRPELSGETDWKEMEYVLCLICANSWPASCSVLARIQGLLMPSGRAGDLWSRLTRTR